MVVDPSEHFGLLTRSLELPSDWLALVTRAEGDRVVHAPGSEVPGDEVADMLLVRSTPWALTFDDLKGTSVDHYQCTAKVTLRVSVIPERGELRSFRNVVVASSRAVSRSDLAQYFGPHVATGLAGAAEGRGVGVLIDPNNRATLAAELAEGLKGSAFAAGMKVDGAISVVFDSPVYRQVSRSRAETERRREEFAAQRRIELAAEEARRQHADHLTELLAKLRDQADRTPDVDLVQLFKTFSDVDRGELYTALFATRDERMATQSIVVGSGDRLLFFAPATLDAPTRTLPLPDTIGAVRSVQVHVDASNEQRLFVGASKGVHELAANGDGEVITYAASHDGEIRGGVNSVALAGDRIWATHSELGLLCWQRGIDALPTSVLSERTKGAQAVRGVRFVDGDIYFAIDTTVCKLRADDPDSAPVAFNGSGSLITAICPTGDGLYCGNAEGEILFWTDETESQPEILHSGRRRSAESVVVQDLGGVRRLFFTDTSLAVFARVIGDTIVCRYEASGQTLRRVETAPDLIVATNEVRDRLICWRPGATDVPYGVITVGRMTGHSIQDVCLTS